MMSDVNELLEDQRYARPFHEFQNLTSFQIGYFTVNSNNGADMIDWSWLKSQPTVEKRTFVRHIELDQPLCVRMNGHRHKGIIIKPK